MSTAPTTPQVAGVDAYEHGYTAGVSCHASAHDPADLQAQIDNVARNLGIDGLALAEWREGVADALSDFDDEARRARLMFR